MSFGYSVGDFLLVIELARTTYINCRRAPREFCEAVQAVKSLYIVLKALEDEVNDPRSPLLQHEQREKDFVEITASCLSVLAELDKIAVKYSSLGTNDAKLRHRLGFPNEKIRQLRGKLGFYTSALSSLLGTVGLGSLGRLEKALETVRNTEQSQARMEQKLDEATCERQEILKAVHDLGFQFRAGAKESSILSAHTDDSKCI
jgi:hypothetical protein